MVKCFISLKSHEKQLSNDTKIIKIRLVKPIFPTQMLIRLVESCTHIPKAKKLYSILYKRDQYDAYQLMLKTKYKNSMLTRPPLNELPGTLNDFHHQSKWRIQWEVTKVGEADVGYLAKNSEQRESQSDLFDFITFSFELNSRLNYLHKT